MEFCSGGFETAAVYDGGMVFYNVFLFLFDQLFTLRLSLFAFFFSSPPLTLRSDQVLTSILSLLCGRALEGFVLLRTFVTDFIRSRRQETNKNYKPLDLIVV